ncbi:hypothetical protein ACH492_07750 [Streptomyces sp. NPDC019443]|uniref:hypothetical protein n=1 Tax=Streptomyces sp. NPDC019443 TaxID=3365061 RepID=UPI0037A81856
MGAFLDELPSPDTDRYPTLHGASTSAFAGRDRGLEFGLAGILDGIAARVEERRSASRSSASRSSA